MREQQKGNPWRSIGDSLLDIYKPKGKIWGPVIQSGTITLLYGYRGSYKSLLSSSLIHALCAGHKFLKWYPERKYRCLLIDGEMGRQNVVSRFVDIARASDIPMSGSSLDILTYEDCGPRGMWNLADGGDHPKYAAAMQGHDVIVIDNLLTCSGPLKTFDDDVSQWRRIQPFLIQQKDQGKAIVLLHHAGKSGAQYGTVLRENIMDTIIKLQRDPHKPKTLEFKFEKTRHFWGDDAESLSLEINNNQWTYWSLSQRRQDEIQARIKSGQKKKDIAEEMGLSYAEVLTLSSQGINHGSNSL